MSTLKADTIQNTSGGAVTLTNQSAAKAWVNFNGTGTVAIRDDNNISSLTDENTGDYTVNFTAALANVNYCTNVTSDSSSKTAAARSPTTYALGTTSSIRVSVYNNAASNYQDCTVVNIAIHGDLA